MISAGIRPPEWADTDEAVAGYYADLDRAQDEAADRRTEAEDEARA